MLNKAKKIVKKLPLRFSKYQEKELGEVPGKLIFVGNQKQNFTKTRLFAYNENDFIEVILNKIEDVKEYQNKYTNIWINIDGLHNINQIQHICKYFNIHSLIQEDIVHTGQTSKTDIEDEFVFSIIKMMSLNKETMNLTSEQFSMYLSENILLTFQEVVGDVFEPVRNRIRNKLGRVRVKKCDYLMYCLFDVITDNYNNIMQYFGREIEELEDKILLNANQEVLLEINKAKLELNFFRKTIRPARKAILEINVSETDLIDNEIEVFYKDLYDGINRAFDTVENYKSMLSEQLTVYSINVNSKMNDIMKILTIFSVIFIPITFIAGIYGTNFNNIPELHYKYSYFIMLGIMIFITGGMLSYFKYKKWF